MTGAFCWYDKPSVTSDITVTGQITAVGCAALTAPKCWTKVEAVTATRGAAAGGRKRGRSYDRDDSAGSGDNGDSGNSVAAAGGGDDSGGEPAKRQRGYKGKRKGHNARRWNAAKGRY